MNAAADTALAVLYGVSPAVIEALRREQCTLDQHWTRLPDGRVLYLPAGLDLIPSALGLEKKEGGPPAPIAAGAEVRSLPILRVCANPIWVIVRAPDDTRVEVRVRHNQRLSTSMRLRCLHVEGRWICVHDSQVSEPALLARYRATTDRTPG